MQENNLIHANDFSTLDFITDRQRIYKIYFKKTLRIKSFKVPEPKIIVIRSEMRIRQERDFNA